MSLDDAREGQTPAKHEVVAAGLRRAINRGDLRSGQRLPSQSDLAAEYKTSRPTVQLALRQLESEGLITTGRGRRAEVVEAGGGVEKSGGEPTRKVRLEEALNKAFRAEDVSIDFFGFTAETLYSGLQRTFGELRERIISPRSVSMRLLLPSEGAHLALPRAVDDPTDPRPQRRIREIRSWHRSALRNQFYSLDSLFDGNYSFVSRVVPLTPTFKLYRLNESKALVGLYQVSRWDMPVGGGATVDSFDVTGYSAKLRQYRYESTEFIEYSAWFEQVWNTIAVDEPS